MPKQNLKQKLGDYLLPELKSRLVGLELCGFSEQGRERVKDIIYEPHSSIFYAKTTNTETLETHMINLNELAALSLYSESKEPPVSSEPLDFSRARETDEKSRRLAAYAEIATRAEHLFPKR